MSRRVIVNGHCTNKYDIIKVGNRTNNIIGSDDISNENNDNVIIIIIKILIKLIAFLMYITSSMITHNDVTRKYVIQKRSHVCSGYSGSHAVAAHNYMRTKVKGSIRDLCLTNHCNTDLDASHSQKSS